jgi:hypothetical protein
MEVPPVTPANCTAVESQTGIGEESIIAQTRAP